jgi:hypothetical protein
MTMKTALLTALGRIDTLDTPDATFTVDTEARSVAPFRCGCELCLTPSS